jgi:hypothetical protein
MPVAMIRRPATLVQFRPIDSPLASATDAGGHANDELFAASGAQLAVAAVVVQTAIYRVAVRARFKKLVGLKWDAIQDIAGWHRNFFL